MYVYLQSEFFHNQKERMKVALTPDHTDFGNFDIPTPSPENHSSTDMNRTHPATNGQDSDIGTLW